jgi:SAM-dependent methyltransferase
MRPIPEIRGLRFPDAFVIRHFFKHGLDKKPGRVIELGSGTGNNLALYQAYGWEVTGVDYDQPSLDEADWNLRGKAKLIQADLSQGLPKLDGGYDVFLAPNIINYIPKAAAERVLTESRALIAAGTPVFLSSRLVDDYRYGRGEEVEPDTFRLNITETGEGGLLQAFYTAHGLVDMLVRTLGLSERTELMQTFDNVQGGKTVRHNSDLIVWGKAG